jgi:hypothetical protein
MIINLKENIYDRKVATEDSIKLFYLWQYHRQICGKQAVKEWKYI